MKVTFLSSSTYKFQSQGYASTEDCILNTVEGLGSEAITESYRSPYQEGETYSNRKYGKRQITIKFTLLGDNSTDLEAKIKRFYSVFNGSTSNKLKFVTGSSYEINAIPVKIEFGERHKDFREGFVTFDCLDPFFKLLPETTVSMNAYSSGLTFPITFPISFGIAGNTQTITNSGNIETPITIVMSGIDTPVLTRSTDKIQLNLDLTSTETVTVDTSFNKRTVVKVSGSSTSNEYSSLSLDSNLFYLNKGSNTLTYTNAGQFSNPTFKVKYYERYAGI